VLAVVMVMALGFPLPDPTTDDELYRPMVSKCHDELRVAYVIQGAQPMSPVGWSIRRC